MIQSLTALWTHFEDEGYEPRIVADLRPWIVVMHSSVTKHQKECWLVCLADRCPHEVYALGVRDLPDTLTLEARGNVKGCYDYMVFCG